MPKRLIIGCICGLILVFGKPTSAKTDRELSYRYDQIWSSAIRFFRVDLGYTISEQDKTAGYILFQFKEAGRTHNGSLELVSVIKGGRHINRLRFNLVEMPRYVEGLLADKLIRKLKREYGDPPSARRVTAPKPQTSDPSDSPTSASDADGKTSESGETDQNASTDGQ